jgi:hypothetical protein
MGSGGTIPSGDPEPGDVVGITPDGRIGYWRAADYELLMTPAWVA